MVNFRRELYPFVGAYLNLDGNALHYLDEGSGDPVVMLHGNPTWSFFYRRLVPALSDRCRVIVPDHIGCGLSDKPDDAHYRYTLEQRVADLGALLDHLGLKKNITLVLHDWGGMIGMAWAVKNPERVRRLVLLNTGAFHLPASKPFPPSLRFCRDSRVGAFLVRGANLFSRAAVRWCCTRSPMPRDVREGYLRPYNSWRNRVAVLRFVQDIPLTPGDPSYELVSETERGLKQFQNTPTLICWGDRDFVFDEHFLAEWKRRLPAAEVHQFADAGHYVIEDAGAEIIPLIQKFLARHPLAA
jgi:haloalkane dehalogenase